MYQTHPLDGQTRVISTTITIKRTDGTLDQVVKPGAINPIMRDRMTKATSDAGRGQVIAWVEQTEAFEVTAQMRATWLHDCADRAEQSARNGQTREYAIAANLRAQARAIEATIAPRVLTAQEIETAESKTAELIRFANNA